MARHGKHQLWQNQVGAAPGYAFGIGAAWRTRRTIPCGESACRPHVNTILLRRDGNSASTDVRAREGEVGEGIACVLLRHSWKGLTMVNDGDCNVWLVSGAPGCMGQEQGADLEDQSNS